MNKDAKIYVAGSHGMVGSAIVDCLNMQGYANVLGTSRAELDLTDSNAVRSWFDEHQPQYVFVAAAKVGGINANNTEPVEFLLQNLRIQNNVIEYAMASGVEKLIFLGSSCVYPKMAPQPIDEDALLTGPLEPTNDAYAIAKIAGIKLCQAYKREYGRNCFSVMPTNLYGPNDNFDLKTSHVLPALIHKFHVAKTSGEEAVPIWGSGKPLREFMHVTDMADACVYLMQNEVNHDVVNIGSGEEVSIAELARLVAKVIGFEGRIEFDASMPDGTPRKRLNTERLASLGWHSKISLEQGIHSTYDWARQHALLD